MNSFPDRHPVLLVHGFLDTTVVFAKMTAYLSNLGWEVHSLNLVPNNGAAGIDELAHQVADYADRHLPSDRPFDLVGFSMGGLVARYYVQRLGGRDRVKRFIAISSPHQGTWTAYTLQRPGCLQMRPGSDFLQDLNQDATTVLGQLNFTSLWTPYDLMIVPANSSQMPVGKEFRVPVLLHPWMLVDARSLKLVAEQLSVPVNLKPSYG